MDYLIEFDYEAEEIDELSIRKGDIVNKVKPHEDGWMMGVLRGKEGVFPSNFGKPLKEDRRKSQDDDIMSEDTKTTNSDEDITPDSGRLQKKVTGVGFGNIFSGGKIQLKQTPNTRDGKTKSIYEENKPDPVAEKKTNLKSKIETARVIHNYTAENVDELTLTEGEIITVLDKDNEDDGWWKGKLANDQIGVFPNNFVELIKIQPEEVSKSIKPQIVPNKGPPPVLAAKPTAAMSKAAPPRPPQLLEVKVGPTKPTARVTNVSKEKEDGVSFEAPVNHTPLVGPNAGRAKRPGKKLPSNVNVVNPNDPIDSSIFTEDENKIITPKAFSNPINNEKSSEILTNKQKPKEPSNFDTIPDIFANKSKTKETTSTEKIPDKTSDIFSNKTKLKEYHSFDKAPDISIAKPKAKEVTVENNFDKPFQSFGGKLKSKENSFLIEKKPEVFESKLINNQSKTLPKKLISDSEPISKNQGDVKDQMDHLQIKVTHLEGENEELKKEITELRKSTNEQINQLKTKLNKMISELDEEKVKRATIDGNVNRLKDTIEDLEIAMLANNKHN